jgi:hypothetical protein
MALAVRRNALNARAAIFIAPRRIEDMPEAGAEGALDRGGREACAADSAGAEDRDDAGGAHERSNGRK